MISFKNKLDFQFYTHVANVEGDDLEQAFRMMNLWEDQNAGQVEIITENGKCSSMSVGDILEMSDGSKYRCASFGFEALKNEKHT
jgi:hypothetical protein